MGILTHVAPSCSGSNPSLKITEVSVTLSTSVATASSSADATLINGTIIGWRPASPSTSTYQIYSITLGTDGSVTVTCIANPANNAAVITVLVATLK